MKVSHGLVNSSYACMHALVLPKQPPAAILPLRSAVLSHSHLRLLLGDCALPGACRAVSAWGKRKNTVAA